MFPNGVEESVMLEEAFDWEMLRRVGNRGEDAAGFAVVLGEGGGEADESSLTSGVVSEAPGTSESESMAKASPK